MPTTTTTSVSERRRPRRKRVSSTQPQGSPLAASGEPVRLAYMPGLQGPCGESLPALVTGHPCRPILLRAFPTIAAALAALRDMNSGKPA